MTMINPTPKTNPLLMSISMILPKMTPAKTSFCYVKYKSAGFFICLFAFRISNAFSLFPLIHTAKITVFYEIAKFSACLFVFA